MDQIFALSVRQPWAELIISGRKTMELRQWSTDYRGMLWIHTGTATNSELESAFGYNDLFKGGYIGSVRLTGVVPLDEDDWDYYRPNHLDAGAFVPGYYGWFLESPQRFATPIPAPGKRSLYIPPPEIVELLNKASGRAGHAAT